MGGVRLVRLGDIYFPKKKDVPDVGGVRLTFI